MSVTEIEVRLLGPAAAARVGVSAATWRKYCSRGIVPPPDGTEELSGRNWWWSTTIDRYLTLRPGAGSRTDKNPEHAEFRSWREEWLRFKA